MYYHHQCYSDDIIALSKLPDLCLYIKQGCHCVPQMHTG